MARQRSSVLNVLMVLLGLLLLVLALTGRAGPLLLSALNAIIRWLTGGAPIPIVVVGGGSNKKQPPQNQGGKKQPQQSAQKQKSAAKNSMKTGDSTAQIPSWEEWLQQHGLLGGTQTPGPVLPVPGAGGMPIPEVVPVP